MNINVIENMTTSVGQNQSNSVGMNITESSGANHTTTAGGMMMKNAVMDYSLMAANITEVAQGERKARAKKMNENAQEKQVNVQGNNQWNSKGKFNNQSGDNSKSY